MALRRLDKGTRPACNHLGLAEGVPGHARAAVI